MNELNCVKTYNTRVEANLDKGYLQSKDIESFVEADDMGGSNLFLFQNSSTGVSLMVVKKDFEKARSVLDMLE